MASLTTFVIGDGPSAAGVRSLVESWTRAGILEPSLWVSPSQISEQPAGPPQVEAMYVHTNGTQTVDLFELIGRYRLDLVRVVAAHLVLHDGQVDSDLTVAARHVAAAVEATLPRRSDSAAYGGCRFHRSLVIVPVTGATGASVAVIEPEWDVNVVISPEDRPDLDRGSIFVRHPGNFEGHAAAALAAVGGILRGVGGGVLDDLAADSTSRESDVIVARVSIRSVVGEDILDEVAVHALDTEALAPVGPAQVLAWARPATQPDLVAASAARDILQAQEWAPTPPIPTAGAATHHQQFWAALGTAASFNLRTVGAITSWALSSGRASVERRATDAIIGDKAGILVTLGPRPVDDLTRASERLIQRESTRIDEEMRLQATRATAPSPDTWARLRTLGLGLVDGGDLGGFPEPRQAGRRELLPATSIVARPGQYWQLADGTRVSADSAAEMRAHQKLLSEELAATKHDLLVARAELLAATALRAEQKAQAKAANPAAAGAASDAVPETTPDDDLLAGLEAQAKSAEALHEAAQGAVEAYAAWFDQHATSALWLIDDDVCRRSEELADSQAKVAEREKEAPPSQSLKGSQRTLRHWWAWTIPTWLALTLATVWLCFGPLPENWANFRITLEQMIYTASTLFVLAAIILGTANHAFYRAVRQYEWLVEMRLSQLRSDKAAFVYAGQEGARLNLLSAGLRDWGHIFAELLHRPLQATERRYEPLPDDVIAALPAAMALAQQPGGDHTVSSPVLVDSYNFVYPQGWASRHFEIAYEAFESNRTAGPSEGYLAVDLDSVGSATSPRSRLRDYWTSGNARDVLSRKAQGDLRVAAQDGELELPARVVSRIGRYGDGETAPERSFFQVMATESTMFAIDLFTPTARQSRRHYVERSVAWMPTSAASRDSSSGVEVRNCAGPTAVRVDLSRRLAATELLPFASDEDVSLGQHVAVTTVAESEEAAQGSAWH